MSINTVDNDCFVDWTKWEINDLIIFNTMQKQSCTKTCGK